MNRYSVPRVYKRINVKKFIFSYKSSAVLQIFVFSFRNYVMLINYDNFNSYFLIYIFFLYKRNYLKKVFH